jgi:hypothetical protein
VGDAQLRNEAPTDRALAAGFFASAYDLNGQTVISFRGTDFDHRQRRTVQGHIQRLDRVVWDNAVAAARGGRIVL